MCVVKKDRWFVATARSAASYTEDVAKARLYPSREAAERNVCPGNETAQKLRDKFKIDYWLLRQNLTNAGGS